MKVTNMIDLYWKSSFQLFRLKGQGSKKFLQGQTTSDIINLTQSKIVRTCFLSPIGRIKALLEIRLINKDIEFIFLGGDQDKVINDLKKVIFPSDNVEIEIAGNIRRIQKISFQKPWFETEFNWLSMNDNTQAYKFADSIEVEKWRLCQGLPIAVEELSGEYNPFELGLSHLINLNKGCYLGQETISKVRNSSQLKQKLCFWSIKELDSFQDIHQGTSLFSAEGHVAGVITSYIKLSSKEVIGVALVRRRYLSNEKLLLDNSSVNVSIETPIGFVDMMEKS